jgi:hypothetical protein
MLVDFVYFFVSAGFAALTYVLILGLDRLGRPS